MMHNFENTESWEDKAGNQGQIKGEGATGAIAPGPPLQGGPCDDIYLF